MASPEKTQGISAFSTVSAPPRPPERVRVPVHDEPLEKPVPAPLEPKLPPEKKPLLQRLARSLAVRLAAAGIVFSGGAGYAAYQEVPAVHQAVDQEFLERLGLKTPEVPSFFDSKADEGVFGDRNMIPKSLQEIQNEFPEQIIAKDNTITFLNPFQLPEGATIPYKKFLSGRLVGDTGGFLKANAEKNGIKDHMTFTLPKDTLIFAPVDAHVMLAKGREDRNEDPNMAESVTIFYYDSKQDRTYELYFFDETDPTKIGLFEPLFSMQENVPDTSRGTNWEKLPVAKQGESLAKTTVEKQRITLGIRAYRGKKIGPEAELIDKTFFLVTPKFLTTSNANGELKVVVMQKENVVE